MNSHPPLVLLLVYEAQRREEDSARRREAEVAEHRRQRRPVRRAVGLSLVRVGHRLAGEPDLHIQPARSR